ncbi:MAG TPA: hypothetical protein VI452_07685 [Marmoricola sp.]|jgi:hypothetical protein
MSEPGDVDYTSTGDDHGVSGGIVTAGSAAIAGFTFAVLSMMGQGTWSLALQSLFFGSSYPQSQFDHVMLAWGCGCLLVAAAGFALARRALHLGPTEGQANLARAAVVVSAAGALLGVLTVIGSLLGH